MIALRGLIFYIAAFSLAGCESINYHKAGDVAAPLLSGLEIAPIEFKPGMPQQHSTLESSIAEGFEEILLATATELKSHPHMKYSLLGFTDSLECIEANCNALSLRRAKSVHDWLLSHGVSASSLTAPKGYGASMPTGDNSTEIGRAQNRRVELSFVPSTEQD